MDKVLGTTVQEDVFDEFLKTNTAKWRTILDIFLAIPETYNRVRATTYKHLSIPYLSSLWNENHDNGRWLNIKLNLDEYNFKKQKDKSITILDAFEKEFPGNYMENLI